MNPYVVMNAHELTVIIITAGMLLTPLFIFATFVFSGASFNKGLVLSTIWLAFGALMTWVCIARFQTQLDPWGGLLVPASWLTPSILLWIYRESILSHPLSQHWLVGLQIFRVIGGVFLLEMGRQNIPGIFAYPAGVGDIIVGLTALAIILFYRRSPALPRWSIMLVLMLGILDFISAFFFGFFSSDNPAQLFYPDVENDLLLYPTGLIPLYLVPYAIFFHLLSWLSLKRDV